MAKKATAKKRPAPVEVEEPALEQYGARTSQAKACAFCKHHYIKPCSDKTKDQCPNFLHLQSRGKKK